MLVENMGQLAAGVGLSRVAGQMYVLLYLSPDSVSLDEMAQKLQISKGSASVNIRELERWGAVKKVWKEKSRKDYYTAETDVTRIVSDRLQYGLTRRLDEVSRAVDSALDTIRSEERGQKDREAEFIRKRLEKIKRMRETASGLIALLGRMGSNSKDSASARMFSKLIRIMV